VLFLNNNNNGLNGNNNLNNNGRFVGIVKLLKTLGHFHSKMNIYKEICDYENLELAFKKARKGKRGKLYVLQFENELEENLCSSRKRKKKIRNME
jgi:hypothetical protein